MKAGPQCSKNPTSVPMDVKNLAAILALIEQQTKLKQQKFIFSTIV